MRRRRRSVARRFTPITGRRRFGRSSAVSAVRRGRRRVSASLAGVAAAPTAGFDGGAGKGRLFAGAVEGLFDQRRQESLFGQHRQESEDEGIVVMRASLMIHAVLAPLLHFVLEILFAARNLRLQLAQQSGEIGEILGGEAG